MTLLGLLLLALGEIVFGGWFPISAKNYPIAFICGPIVIWTAFRFHPARNSHRHFHSLGSRHLGHAAQLRSVCHGNGKSIASRHAEFHGAAVYHRDGACPRPWRNAGGPRQ